jgi:hypothetical protein
MNNKFYAFLLLSGSIFAAPAAEKIENDSVAFTEKRNELMLKGELTEAQKNLLDQNIGHFTFTLAPSSTLDDFGMTLPIFLVGYQSAIYPTTYNDAASVEFGGGAIAKNHGRSKYIWYHPKLMGIKYVNPYAESRYFGSYGLSLMSISGTLLKNGDWNYHHGTFLAPCIAAGVELGSPKKAISKIQLSIDQPLITIYQTNFNVAPVATLSYTIGF